MTDSFLVHPQDNKDQVDSDYESTFARAASFETPDAIMSSSRSEDQGSPYKPGCVGAMTKKTVYNFRKELRRQSWASTPASISSERVPIIGRLPRDRSSYKDLDGGKTSTFKVLWEMLFGNYLNILLLFAPFAVYSHNNNWSPVYVFLLNFAAMIPLAALLGDFTEEVAAHTNQTVGGLVNATFGNAVEVVVAIQALLADEIRIVQATILGSIFSNLLLVLGCCFFFGGIKYKEQSFNSVVATANMGLMGLSCIALVLPTPFAKYYEADEEEALGISRLAAAALMFMYLQLLFFQLKTHADLFDDDDEDEPDMPFWVSMMGLTVLTGIITKLSDYLVGSIDGFCTSSGISRTFVGIIILPIVGNAVEHITAISVAVKNKMDLAMGGK